MNRVMCVWLLASGLFGSTYGQKLCDFSDVDCMTKGAIRVYEDVVAGIKDLFDPLDPIFLAEVDRNVLNINYKLENATMKGLANCKVTQLICKPEESSYEHDLQCPELKISYIFKSDGATSDGQPEKGVATVIADDYMLIVRGKYKKVISETDQKPRISIETYDIETIPRGPFTYEIHDFENGDKAKFEHAEDDLNQNWKKLKLEFMKVFMKAIRTYLITFPLEKWMG